MCVCVCVCVCLEGEGGGGFCNVILTSRICGLGQLNKNHKKKKHSSNAEKGILFPTYGELEGFNFPRQLIK